jgi:fido (protein-threonine AMPylation protein)
VLVIVGAINQQDDHEKNRNYWKYPKAKLRKEQSEVVSDTTQLKLTMEGNGRSTRIWLDMVFKKRMKMCVDWSKIDKKDYLDAMIASHTDSSRIHELLKGALTDKIDDREIFMKGIDYSYYYEQEE